jgi:hypothetical protein
MNRSNRRIFMIQAAASGTLVLAGRGAQAATPILSESDPAAVKLGYTPDTSKVDVKQFPKHEASQDCGGCQLFESIPDGNEPYGNCPLFEGRRVAVKGWCSSWV